MTTPSPRRRAFGLTVPWLLLLAVPPAAALPPNHSISLQGAVSGQGGTAAPGVALAAGWWLEGDVEATARLALRVAPRPGVRRTVGALVGVRWAPGSGRWRPFLGLEAGLGWEGRGGAAVAARAGVERLLRRDWGLSAAAGLAWEGRAAAREGALVVTCYF